MGSGIGLGGFLGRFVCVPIVFGTAVSEAADLNLGLFFWTATGF